MEPLFYYIPYNNNLCEGPSLKHQNDLRLHSVRARLSLSAHRLGSPARLTGGYPSVGTMQNCVARQSARPVRLAIR